MINKEPNAQVLALSSLQLDKKYEKFIFDGSSGSSSGYPKMDSDHINIDDIYNTLKYTNLKRACCVRKDENTDNAIIDVTYPLSIYPDKKPRPLTINNLNVLCRGLPHGHDITDANYNGLFLEEAYYCMSCCAFAHGIPSEKTWNYVKPNLLDFNNLIIPYKSKNPTLTKEYVPSDDKFFLNSFLISSINYGTKKYELEFSSDEFSFNNDSKIQKTFNDLYSQEATYVINTDSVTLSTKQSELILFIDEQLKRKRVVLFAFSSS